MTNPSIDEKNRQRLLNLRVELEELEAMSAESRKPAELDQSMVGRLSRMDAMQAVKMSQEASRRRQQTLKRIVGALMRIDAGNYGYCTLFDEQIPFGRLAIDPTYSLCIHCAEASI